jgi:hypothetical protein
MSDTRAIPVASDREDRQATRVQRALLVNKARRDPPDRADCPERRDWKETPVIPAIKASPVNKVFPDLPESPATPVL